MKEWKRYECARVSAEHVLCGIVSDSSGVYRDWLLARVGVVVMGLCDLTVSRVRGILYLPNRRIFQKGLSSK